MGGVFYLVAASTRYSESEFVGARRLYAEAVGRERCAYGSKCGLVNDLARSSPEPPCFLHADHSLSCGEDCARNSNTRVLYRLFREIAIRRPISTIRATFVWLHLELSDKTMSDETSSKTTIWLSAPIV